MLQQERLLCYWTTLKEGEDSHRFLFYWIPDSELLGASDMLGRVYETTLDKKGRQGLLRNMAMDMVDSKWKRTIGEKGFRLEKGMEDGSIRLLYIGKSVHLMEVQGEGRKRERNADLITRLMEERDELKGALSGDSKAETVKHVSPKATTDSGGKRRKVGKAVGARFDGDDEVL